MNIYIDEILKEKALSKTEIAKRMGLSRESLYRILSGNPTLDNLNKLADALNVEVWELFTESTAKSDFTAMVKNGKDYYNATTLSELEKIVAEIKEKQ